MDAPKVKKYPFIDEIAVAPNDEIIKKWAGVIGKIPKGPLPKIISSQKEFVLQPFEKNFTLPFKKVSTTIAVNQPPPPLMKGLKATWSVEAAEDLKAVHSIDIEEELIQAVSDQIAKEVDQQIIKDLIGQVQEAERQVQEAERKARAEKKREATWRGTFGIIGRRYLDPEEVRAEEESEIITVERKVIVIVPDLPFGLGYRRVLA
jgi:hypothetical protein